MDDIYEWLFDKYALPQMEDIAKGQNETLGQLSEVLCLSQRGRRSLQDVADNMRVQWGTEAFVLGVRMGLGLYGPRTREADCGKLSYLFPQLDDPVS